VVENGGMAMGWRKVQIRVDVAAATVLWSRFEEDFEPCRMAVHHVLMERALYGRFISTPSREIDNAQGQTC